MPVVTVKKMGEKSLLEPSIPVEDFSSKALYDLIEDMKATMEAEQGVGIAAPQIGCNRQIVLFGFEHCERYPES